MPGPAPARSASGSTRPPPRPLAVSFGTYYAADRRVPGKGLLKKIATKTGKADVHDPADFGMNGAFHPDSARHHGWKTVAALIATTKATAGDRPRGPGSC
ncbi:hypothetical protein [Streptomyces platensis]